MLYLKKIGHMKKLLLFFFIIFFIQFASLKAQAPDWAWAKSAGGTGSEGFYSCATDQFGNTYVTGFFSSPSITFGATTLTNANAPGDDILIVKYDAIGNVLWAISAGGNSNDFAVKITLDTYGNVYIIGYYYSTSITFGTTTFNSSSPGVSDIFVAKYDSSGNLLWAKSNGGQGDVNGIGITTDNAGDVYITGQFGINVDFGGTILTSAGYQDMFIVKYDSLGNILWAKAAGGTHADSGYDIICDILGNVFVTGKFISPTITFGVNILTNNAVSSEDIFLVKYDAAGNVHWATRAGGSGNEYGRSLSADTLGHVFVTGSCTSPTISFGGTILTNAGIYDMFIAQYDTSGNELWCKVVGNLGADYGRNSTIDGAGNVYITGIYASEHLDFDLTTITNASGGEYDIFIAKYDVLGNVIWVKSFGGLISDYSQSIYSDASGNLIVTGYFNSNNIIFNSDTLTNSNFSSNYSDIFIAKLSNLLVDSKEKITDQTSVFPNPSSGIFMLNDKKNITSLEVFNMMGELVLSQGNAKQINLQAFPKGIYIARINGMQVCRLVKE